MSFWGGFVEGFATEVGKAIDKDVERTNELVDDTIKIGLNKYLENEEEIKKEKKTIRDEIDTLVGLNFSLPKAASIVKAGLTTQLAKLALDEDYRGDPNKLWDGTTKYSEESGLTVQDVVDKLVKTPKFDVGNLKVSQPQGSLLSALGLGTDVSSRIKSGIDTRVGGMTKATASRDDIAVTPGSVPTDVKKLLASSSGDTIDKRVIAAIDALDIPQEEKNNLFIRIKAGGKIPNILGIQFPGMSSTAGGANLPQNMQQLKNLAKLAKNGDKNAEEQLAKEIDAIEKIMGPNYADSILDSLD
jgi:hypothetical protein